MRVNAGWYRKAEPEKRDRVHFFDNIKDSKKPWNAVSLCGSLMFTFGHMVGGAKKPYHPLCKHCQRMVRQ